MGDLKKYSAIRSWLLGFEKNYLILRHDHTGVYKSLAAFSGTFKIALFEQGHGDFLQHRNGIRTKILETCHQLQSALFHTTDKERDIYSQHPIYRSLRPKQI